MEARLPALDPEQYVVLKPPPAMSKRPGQLWEQFVLPARARRLRAALVYNPANLAPLAFPRNVVQIFDAVALRHPEWYSKPYVRWQRQVMPRIAKRAELVITVSEFSRAEICEFLGVSSERIRVVPGGVDARFTPSVDTERVQRALGITRPYVLTVGDRGPRKNLDALRPVANRMRSEGIDVLVAGGGRAHQLGTPLPGVRDLGYIAEDLLPGLYAGALAFALPSLHEGFGLTALEAMAAGVPVVASSRGALPELVGDAGLTADPDDWGDFAAAVSRAAGDTALRERLRAKGIELASRYTWERTARAVHGHLCRLAR